MKSKITKDFTKFNEKMKKLKKKAVTIEVGLFDAEQARKGRLLEYGDTNQVPRPWFTKQMNPKMNKEIVDLVEITGQKVLEGTRTLDDLGQELQDLCRDGVVDVDMPKLTEYTELVKAGLLVRPETGKMRQSVGAAEQIGQDSGAMLKSVKYKIIRRRRK